MTHDANRAPARIYLSGPMTGYAEYNFPAFHAAAARLRAEGHEVFNPAEQHGGDTTLPWHVYLRHDIRALCDCDAIALLPGWERSRGAMLEVQVAGALGLRVMVCGPDDEDESPDNDEITRLRGEAVVLRLLLGRADAVLQTIETDDADEEDHLAQLRMAIARAVETQPRADLFRTAKA